ncbi:MAG TPA: SMP-30/gluconolactonase/LRE family protein [Noviherbaspirillum sp.]|jgi:sugar lactone lactonase YvrE|uniref:SMP-30/gluconolactonase/LRE family protein n=1 Tax=Noviherbaspirillum sp. TaxID=1926288 RepID=UPI002DDD888B|nr:SMP-30/gluconolactonase/LRE family protein [Noviherbaspirillum sp.]HEV2612430.1 SMP-30/gluconolactonase/LRE family protein [Noviherbaspirillum sp.]
MADFDVLYDKPMLLGESPLWHENESSLYWIDITGKTVHRHTPGTGCHSSWSLPSEPGCIARCESGALLVAMRSGVALLDTSTGELAHVADAPYDASKMRFNDGRCDGMGRLWAGTLYEPKDQPLASLYCVERGIVRRVGNPVTVSNGVAFSIDQRTLYHADTTAHRITAYDFDLENGVIGQGRLFKQFSTDKSHNYGGRPDGAAVDSEDCYWCAMYEGGQLIRFSPKGEILRQIQLPLRCPTMLAFGGEDLCTVYITTARNNRPDRELAEYPLSGYVLSFKTDVPGKPDSAYLA